MAQERTAPTPQAQLVLDYLKSGRTLTPLLAMTNLGIASLTTRISELSKLGFNIIAEWQTDYHKRRYKTYRLEETDQA